MTSPVIQYPTWSDQSSKPVELITNISSQNAAALVYAAVDGINSSSELAQSAIAFTNGLADPNKTDFWGNYVTDASLTGVGYFQNNGATGAIYSPNGVVAPVDLLVEAITLPVIDAAPTYTQNNLGFVWDETMWDLSLLTAVQAKLLSDLANGGYGIEPADEAALWQREREREQLAGESAIQEASRQAAARGMMLPPGVLNRQIQAAQRAALEKSSSASRDIAMKRADLYVQNRQFTIEKAVETERALVEYLSAYFGRKLDALKANLEAYRISVEIYDAQVKAYMAKLGAQEAGIRMKVEVIDAQVKVNMAAVSKYEALLRGEIQKAELSVSAFRAQIENGVAITDSTYKSQSTRIDAAKARLLEAQYRIQNTVEMNKTKLGAMENAAKLFIEPTNALAGMANAYVQSSSSISAAFT
jgi:hypothetical protein